MGQRSGGVLWVAIWPAATTVFLVLDHGHWSNYLVLLGLVLAYGATITSLGLALATWVSRLGRAVALCVDGLCRPGDRLAHAAGIRPGES